MQILLPEFIKTLPSDIYGDIELMKTKQGRAIAKQRAYHKHDIVGALACLFMFFVTFQAYQLIGRLLLSVSVILIAAVAWEVLREAFYNSKADKGDVRFSVYGAIQMAVIIAIIKTIIILTVK